MWLNLVFSCNTLIVAYSMMGQTSHNLLTSRGNPSPFSPMNPKIFPGNQESEYSKNKSFSDIRVLGKVSDQFLNISQFSISYMGHNSGTYTTAIPICIPLPQKPNIFVKSKNILKHFL